MAALAQTANHIPPHPSPMPGARDQHISTVAIRFHARSPIELHEFAEHASIKWSERRAFTNALSPVRIRDHGAADGDQVEFIVVKTSFDIDQIVFGRAGGANDRVGYRNVKRHRADGNRRFASQLFDPAGKIQIGTKRSLRKPALRKMEEIDPSVHK